MKVLSCRTLSSTSPAMLALGRFPRFSLHSIDLGRRQHRHVFNNAHAQHDRLSLCIAGNGARGNARSLFLEYNDRLFVFNCGEGLQRTISNLGFKSSRIERVYLTSNEWQNVSGMASVLLTRHDARIKQISIVGPKGCDKAIAECTRFDTKLRHITYQFVDDKHEQFRFDDGKLSIEPIVHKSSSSTQSIAYHGRVIAQAGSISLDKCYHLRVPRHKVSNLERGEDVHLEDGKLIRPQDVCERDQPERAFLILEVINDRTLELMKANPRLQSALEQSDCIVHFTHDQHLVASQQYRQLFQSTPSSTYHLVISENNPSLSLFTMHSFHNQLNHIDSVLFPKLEEATNQATRESTSTKVIQCPTGLTYHLRYPPNQSEDLSLSRIPPIEYENREDVIYYQDGQEREGLDECLTQLAQAQESLEVDESLPHYPEFVFLGTASSVGLPIRNVSSILVNINPESSILLDCGEGTYGQLMRFYGAKDAGNILDRLKLIFISHHHSDHHLGLVELLARMNQTRPLLLLPPSVGSFLTRTLPSNFASLHRLDSKYRHVLANRFDASKLNLSRFGLRELYPVQVQHCAYAYGVVMVTMDGYKFVYSGDTVPCESLIKHGMACHLLIHEATVEDNLANFARAHFHTTISQAINVAERMEARFTMLTHFSQRYGKLPYMLDQYPSIGLAFDNMRVTPRTVPRVPLMHHTLKAMYGKHLDNLSYRSELYKRRSDRLDGYQ